MPRRGMSPRSVITEKLDGLLEIYGDAQIAIEITYGSLEKAPPAARAWFDKVTRYYEPDIDPEDDWAENRF